MIRCLLKLIPKLEQTCSFDIKTAKDIKETASIQ